MSKSIERSKTILLVDIAHNSVGVGVLVIANGMKPRLLAAWRETFEHLDVSYERMFMVTLRTVRKLIEKANSAGYLHWDDIYCSVGSPWVLTHVRNAKYTRDKAFVVTEKLLTELAQNDIERFFNRAESDLLPFAQHSQMLDHRRIMTRVNGHALKNPIGQRAKEVECAYLVSSINPDNFNELRSALYAVAHREPTIHAVQRTQLEALRLLQGATNFVLFDFHGGVGECSVVRDNVLTVTATTPISEESYLRDLAGHLGKTVREATVVLDMQAKGMLETALQDKLQQAHRAIADAYTKEFRHVLVAVAEHGLLPNHAFFIADYGSQFFNTLLTSQEYSPLSLLHSPLKPIQLSHIVFHDLVDTNALRRQDTALLLSALVCSK